MVTNDLCGAIKSMKDLKEFNTIDFLFIDHDKDAYLSDLKKIENLGCLQKGSTVVADNVLFARIDNYLSYVRNKHNLGSVCTKTIKCQLEYSSVDADKYGRERFEDGIEVSVVT